MFSYSKERVEERDLKKTLSLLPILSPFYFVLLRAALSRLVYVIETMTAKLILHEKRFETPT